MLVAIPITEIAVGLDVIGIVTVLAPELALVIGVILVAVILYRWWDRQQVDLDRPFGIPSGAVTKRSSTRAEERRSLENTSSKI